MYNLSNIFDFSFFKAVKVATCKCCDTATPKKQKGNSKNKMINQI